MERVWMLVLFLCLMLTGCGMEVKSNSEIKEDILDEQVVLNGQSPCITWLDVIQRQTNKNDKMDRIFVLVEGRAELVNYTCQYELNYEYFDHGGWILQNIQPFKQEEWTIDYPNEDQLREDLMRPMALDLPGISTQCVEWSNAVHSEDLTECTVFATVHGANEYAKGVFPIRAKYMLSRYGWIYQHAVIDHESAVVTPVSGVAEAAALEDAAYQFDFGGSYTVTDHLDEFAWGSQTWHLQNRVSGEYLDVIRDVQLVYYFDNVRLCWVLDHADVVNTEYQWNIAGSWRSIGTGNGLYGDYDYDLTMDTIDLGDGQFQIDYCFTGCYGLESQPNGDRIIPDYSGTIYADASQTEYRGTYLSYTCAPKNQYAMDLDPHDFFGTLYISAEDGLFLYQTTESSLRQFVRQ